MAFDGANYQDPFIGDLVNFVAGDDFQTMFEQFFLEHAEVFTNEEEHKLEYMEIYQDFHIKFERQLEKFCEKENMSQNDFMRKCREASTEDAKAKHYIDILMSSVEYDTFVKLMKIMRPVAIKKKAEAKNSSDEQSGAKGGAKDGDDIDHYADEKQSTHSSDYAAGEKGSSDRPSVKGEK